MFSTKGSGLLRHFGTTLHNALASKTALASTDALHFEAQRTDGAANITTQESYKQPLPDTGAGTLGEIRDTVFSFQPKWVVIYDLYDGYNGRGPCKYGPL